MKLFSGLILFLLFLLPACIAQTPLPIRIGIIYSNATANAAQTFNVGVKMFPALLQRFTSLIVAGQVNGMTSTVLNDDSDIALIDFVYRAANTATLADIRAATRSLVTLPANQRPHFLICPLGDAAEGCLLANEDLSTNPQGPVPAIAPGTPNTAQFQCLVDPNTNKLPTNCLRAGQRRFNYAFGILADAQRYFQPFVSLLRLANAKSVVLVTEDSYSFNSHVTIGALNALREAKIEASVFTIPTARAGTPVIAIELAQKIVDFIGTLSMIPDAIFIASQSCYDLPSLFNQINFAPRSSIMVQCFRAGIETEKRSVLKFHFLPLQWDARLKGSQYTETSRSLVPLFVETASTQLSYSLITNKQPNTWMTNGTKNLFSDGNGGTSNVVSSAAQFAFFYRLIMNTLPDYATGAVCAGFTTILGALRSANSTNPQSLINALNTYYETSYFGLLAFNRYGYNEQREVALGQYDAEGDLQIVAPLSAATASQIYPMPTWEDRIYAKEMYTRTSEVAMFIVIAIVSTITLALMGAVLYYRKHPIIKAASWLFSSIMGLGCIMAYMAILTWPLENDATTCAARHWFFTLPFHIFMDPLIAKSLRILRIFFADQFKVQKISDRLVSLHAFLLFCPQLIINIIWSAVDTPTPVIKVPDPLRVAKNYTDCSANYTTAFMAVSVVYALIIVAFGCVMAYKVRLTVGMFNDAKSIAMAIYMFSLPSVIIGAIQLFIATPDNRSALFVLRSLGLLVAYFSAYTILYVPRLLDVYFNAPLDNVYRSSLQGRNGGAPGSGLNKNSGIKGGSGLHAPLTPVRTVYMVPTDNKEKQLVTNDNGNGKGRDRNNSLGDKEEHGGLISKETKMSTIQKDTNNNVHAHRGSVPDRSSMTQQPSVTAAPVSTLGGGGGGGGKLPMIPKVKSALTSKQSAATANTNLQKPVQVSTITVNQSNTLNGENCPLSPSTKGSNGDADNDSPQDRPKPAAAWNGHH